MSPARWQNPSRYQCPSIVMTCTGSTTRVVSSSRDPDRYSISTDRPASVASRTAPRNPGVSTSSPTAARDTQRRIELRQRPPQRVVVRARAPPATTAPTPPRRTPPPASTAAAARTPRGGTPAPTSPTPRSPSACPACTAASRSTPPAPTRPPAPARSCRTASTRRRSAPRPPAPATRSRPTASAAAGSSRLLAQNEVRPPRRFCPHRTRRPPPCPAGPSAVSVSRLRLLVSVSAVSHSTSSSRNARRLEHGGVVGQAEDPRADGGEGRHAEDELDRAVVVAGARPCPRRPDRRRGGLRAASTRMRISTRSAASVSHGSSGSAASMSMGLALGHDALGAAGLSPRDVALDAVDAERAHGVAVEVPRDEVPVAEAEPQAERAPRGGRAPCGRRTPRWPSCARPRRGR